MTSQTITTKKPGHLIRDPAEEERNGAQTINKDDIQYWTDYAVPVISQLLKQAATYTAHDQAAHTKFVEDHIMPALGPRPREAWAKPDSPWFVLTHGGSPFEPSMNFSTSRGPVVRFSAMALSDYGGADDPFCEAATRRWLPAIAAASGNDAEWIHTMMDNLFPTPEERAVIRDGLAAEGLPFTKAVRVPPNGVFGFDLVGSTRMMKVYFGVTVKHLATGQPKKDIALHALRSCRNSSAFAPCLDFLDSYLSQHPDFANHLDLVSHDCEDPRSPKSRMKAYFFTDRSSFNYLKEIMTFDGKRRDNETKKALEMLRRIWGYLYDEPDGIPDDDWEKPINMPDDVLLRGLLFSLEMRPGKEFPDVKIYVPRWQYMRNDKAAADNFEKILRELKLGGDWGYDGKYEKCVVETL